VGVVEIQWRPDARKLRQFAACWLVGFGAIGLIVAWKGGALSGSGRWTVPIVLWWLGAVVGTVGLAVPWAVRPAYVLAMGLALPIGWVVGHVVLAVVYFGVFTPVAIVFRRRGRDALQRDFDGSADSYWVDRKPRASDKSYLNQF
jgi:hypothetical protein